MANKTTKWSDLKKTKLSSAKLAAIEVKAKAMAFEMELRDLREAAGVTQVDLAKDADIAQSELSKIERRDDHLLSTLRRYVRALGGDLEVVAVLGNKRITLLGV